MAITSEARALPFFTDLQGLPLSSGFIYIGQAGLDPVAYPAVITSDIAGTTVVAQPVRTTNGHAAASGALIHLFVPIPYSITILDSAGRLVYASLNETDPVAIAIGSSSVQSAADFTALRARSGSSTNQVWVNGSGMYVYVPTDNTSPENIPFVIVGNDGSRYHLSSQFGNINFAKISGSAPLTNSQGLWVSWNDDSSGTAFLTNNYGLGAGGIILRTVAPNGLTVLGSVTISPGGGLTSTSDIRSGGNLIASSNLIANGGVVSVTADGSRGLSWNAGAGQYVLSSAPLLINGSLAITQATIQASILANQQANGVGSVALGTNTNTNPVLPGTWAQTGTANNSVFLYVRTA